MTGFVYAIESAGRIKLGFSKDPERRFSKVATDAPFPCELLGFWPGSKADEMAVHKRFEGARVHGEWFTATEALLAFVADNMIAPPARRSVVILCGHEVTRGSQKAIAQALGVTQGAISQWKQVPADRVLAVEAATGVSRHVLRPDVFGAEPDPLPRQAQEASA